MKISITRNGETISIETPNDRATMQDALEAAERLVEASYDYQGCSCSDDSGETVDEITADAIRRVIEDHFQAPDTI